MSILPDNFTPSGDDYKPVFETSDRNLFEVDLLKMSDSSFRITV